jgi:hypothetical protein
MPLRIHRYVAAGVATAVLVGSVVAQEKPPAAAPPQTGPVRGTEEDLQPAVDTSATPDDAQPKTAPRATRAAKPVAQPPQPMVAAPAKPKAGAKDRIELDPTQITGNRELPKVLYIVPWKRSDLSDLTGRPANSLLDEVLAPVDRDVFKRENRYYGVLNPDEPAGAAGATGAPPRAPAASGAADSPRARDEK